MWASREVRKVHKKGGGDFRPAFIRAFTMFYRLAGRPCNDKWSIGAPEEMGPAKETAEVISQLRRRNWSALNQVTLKQISLCGNGTKCYMQHIT